MPLDPFFTSSAKDEFHEMKQKKRALAKALATREHLRFCSEKSRQKALNHDRTISQIIQTKGRAAQGVHEVSGRSSITGFKAPKKKWILRNSHDPKGRII